MAGKRVLSLAYEAYEPLAVKSLSDLANRVLEEHSSILHIAIHHRLGLVPVGEASVMIAVSSPHRKESFRAVEWLLEALKRETAIWKKEQYDDGDALWKENQ